MARLVVGAIILDPSTAPARVLAARRTRPAELAGKWEFPGGKVELGEAPAAALVREIREELGVPIRVGEELSNDGGPWPISAQYELRLLFAEVVAGEVAAGSDHDELRWLGAEELDEVDWLPSDRQALARLREVLASGLCGGAVPARGPVRSGQEPAGS